MRPAIGYPWSESGKRWHDMTMLVQLWVRTFVQMRASILASTTLSRLFYNLECLTMMVTSKIPLTYA